MKRVLVTRPEPLASKTARRLADAGHVPIVLPLSSTHPLPLPASGIPQHPGAVAITSASAIRALPHAFLAAIAGIPCFAVGRATAAQAREAGFRTVAEGPGDAAGLARLVAESVGTAPVIYLCGRVRRSEFEERLAGAGVLVSAVETYDTVGLRPPVERVTGLLDGKDVDAALVYSATAAEALRDLVARPQLAASFAQTSFHCLSPRIGERLDDGSGRRILVAAEPTEEALLFLLSRPG